jgi:hypothetical protein
MNNLKRYGTSCRMPLSCLGPLAQLGERLVRNQEVAGSIPARSTKFNQQLTTISVAAAGAGSAAVSKKSAARTLSEAIKAGQTA